MDYHEIVKKLVGPIKPQGDSSMDQTTNNNLTAMIHLAEMLMMDIQDVKFHTDGRPEASIKRANEKAYLFCKQLAIEE